jgi:predicted metal-dependent HD superfamily phosphohydrolase
MATSKPLVAERWSALLASLGCPADRSREAFADLARRYGEAGRYYHTLDHVAAVLDSIESLSRDEPAPPAGLLAGWFHDVVYDSRAADNEERSVEHARVVLGSLGLPGEVIAETARLVLLTKTHEVVESDRAGQIFLDADLAILGAEEAEYDCYAEAIRREYAWVADEAYRMGRRRVLEGFLRRPRIYRTEEMFARCEDRARGNLGREIGALSERR